MKIKVIMYDMFTDSFIETEESATTDDILLSTVEPSVIEFQAAITKTI